MKFMLIPALLNCFLCCVIQTSGVTIESVPGANANGFIDTELEKTVSLTCKHDTVSEDENELVWLRNDALVSLNEENKKGQSSICISPVILEDREVTFTCHLKSNSLDRDFVVLNVTYPPSLSGSEEVTVEEEATLELQCNIEASPPVSSVTWTINGTEVDLVTGGFTLTNDGFISRLSTDKVVRSLHQATYQCSVSWALNSTLSRDFNVTVTDKKLKFPLWPMISGIVVVCLTIILALFSRWKKIIKCCK